MNHRFCFSFCGSHWEGPPTHRWYERWWHDGDGFCCLSFHCYQVFTQKNKSLGNVFFFDCISWHTAAAKRKIVISYLHSFIIKKMSFWYNGVILDNSNRIQSFAATSNERIVVVVHLYQVKLGESSSQTTYRYCWNVPFFRTPRLFFYLFSYIMFESKT